MFEAAKSSYLYAVSKAFNLKVIDDQFRTVPKSLGMPLSFPSSYLKVDDMGSDKVQT